jgi:hypothetical protein
MNIVATMRLVRPRSGANLVPLIGHAPLLFGPPLDPTVVTFDKPRKFPCGVADVRISDVLEGSCGNRGALSCIAAPV